MKLELSKKWFEQNIEPEHCGDVAAGAGLIEPGHETVSPQPSYPSQRVQSFASLLDMMHALKAMREARGVSINNFSAESHLPLKEIASFEDGAQLQSTAAQLNAYAHALNANVVLQLRRNELDIAHDFPHIATRIGAGELGRIQEVVKHRRLLEVGNEEAAA